MVLVVDRAAEWREIALSPPAAMKVGVDRGSASFHPASPTSPSSCAPFATRSSPTARSKTAPRRNWRASAARSNGKSGTIQESLRGYLRRLAEGGTVQDELITIRGERFVIPIKIEQKRRVQGVVHGASSSGQTVFVEPLETIEQNNELVRLLDEELAEIHRILLEMTRRIGESSEPILQAVDVLAELELQFAKARFAEDYNCVPVSVLGEQSASKTHVGTAALGCPGRALARLVLHNARHPLLERNLKAKGRARRSHQHRTRRRNAANWSSPAQTPAAKRSRLKTVGLLALMAQSGIPVPADRAELPVFDAVLADIGDYQSIEQNLSTFSAHVTNIDFISRTATAQSLVLLDELGSATDPEEGAALAVAIADHFRRIGCITIISTHHTSLKVYGANTPGVVNSVRRIRRSHAAAHLRTEGRRARARRRASTSRSAWD